MANNPNCPKRHFGCDGRKQGCQVLAVEAPDTAAIPFEFSSALSIHGGDPRVEAEIAEMYSSFSEFREEGDFIAPTSDMALPEEEVPSVSLPPEVAVTAATVMGSHGFRGDSAKEIIQQAVSSLGLNRDTRLVPAETAAATVSALLADTEDSGAHALVERIRSGKTVLTYSELAVLSGARDEALLRQQLPYLTPLDGQGWIPPAEQRRCTICQQFVGVVGSHSCSWDAVDAALARLEGERGRRKVKVKTTLLNSEGTPREIELEYSAFKGLDAIPEEHLQDLYMGIDRAFNARGDSHLLLGFYDKPLFGGPGELKLPDKLRDAYIESPSRFLGAGLVAESISPPFSRHELLRILETGGSKTAEDLLTSPRVRGEIEDLLANHPLDSGRDLVRSGGLPPRVVDAMATCGDPMVRRQATLAPNMSEQTLMALATDPDPDVRAGIVYGVQRDGKTASAAIDLDEQLRIAYSPGRLGVMRGYRTTEGTLIDRNLESTGLFKSQLARNPQLVRTFVNDPDDRIALAALACHPFSRQSVQALGQVTSRRRLQVIADHLPRIWPTYDGDAGELSPPHPEGVRWVSRMSIQEARLVRSRTVDLIRQRLDS